MSSYHISRTLKNSALFAMIANVAIFGTVSLANAAPVYVNTNLDFGQTDKTITLGGGVASFIFSYYPNGGATTIDAISTGGNGQVNYFSFFGDRPVSFQIDTLIGATGYDFKAFTTPAPIDYSIVELFLGLKYTLPDGDHFAFAETFGTTLVGYGFETQANTPIRATERIGAVDVPEPLTLSIFGAGIVGAGALRRRRNAKP